MKPDEIKRCLESCAGGEYGESVFLTKEEAEKAIIERKRTHNEI